MSCCQAYEPLVERMLADQIADDERERLLTHAEGCDGCRAYVDLHHHMLEADLGRELPDNEQFAAMRGNVLRSIRGAQTLDRPAGPVRLFAELLRSLIARPAFAAAVAGLMILALGLGVVIGRSGQAPLTAQLPPAPAGDAWMVDLNREARDNRGLSDLENSRFVYSNVSIRDVGQQVELEFDVTRRVEFSRGHDDPLVKEVLAHALINPSPLGTRLKAIRHAGGVQDPKITEALIFSMLSDPDLPVRLKAMQILSSYESDPAIQEAWMAVLSQDDSVQMRMLAMDRLAESGMGEERFGQLLDDLRPQEDRALLVRAGRYEQ